MEAKARFAGIVRAGLLLHLVATSAFGDEYFFTTLAGSPGNPGDGDGAGSSARFNAPAGLAVDSAGNVYVADRSHTIRKITPDGTVATLAGQPGQSGSADGIGGDARFWFPNAVAVDASGQIYVADGGYATIRKITPEGRVTTLPIRSVQPGAPEGFGLVTRFDYPVGIAVDESGNVFVADSHDFGPPTIHKLTATGEFSIIAALRYPSGAGGYSFYNATGLTLDGSGNILVAETPSGRIQKVALDGTVTTFSSGFVSPYAVATDVTGAVYVANWGSHSISKLDASGGKLLSMGSRGTGDGKGADVQFDRPTSVAVDHAGNIYVADTGNHTIRKGVPVTPGRVSDSRLANLSVRSHLYPDLPLIVGFTARGGTRPLLVRAIGPGLRPVTPAGAVLSTNPRLGLWQAAALIALNINWVDNADRAALSATFARAGAFPLPEAGGDAALLYELNGNVTAHLDVGTDGITLLEGYDASDAGAGRLVNLAARYSVGSGDNALTAGFVITGTEAKTLLIRGVAVAPTAPSAALLRDPRIEVYNRAAQRIAENDDWPASLANVARDAGAFPLAAGSKDAAVLLTLAPGTYTVVLSANDRNSGDGLLEIYEVQ